MVNNSRIVWWITALGSVIAGIFLSMLFTHPSKSWQYPDTWSGLIEFYLMVVLPIIPAIWFLFAIGKYRNPNINMLALGSTFVAMLFFGVSWIGHEGILFYVVGVYGTWVCFVFSLVMSRKLTKSS